MMAITRLLACSHYPSWVELRSETVDSARMSLPPANLADGSKMVNSDDRRDDRYGPQNSHEHGNVEGSEVPE